MKSYAKAVVLLLPLWWSTTPAAQVSSAPEVSARLSLAAGEVRLLEIDQQDVDLLVTVDDGKRQSLVNHPLGHSGPQLLLVGPYPVATGLLIKATVIDGAPLATLALQSQSLMPNDPAIPVYRALTEAGKQYHLGTDASLSTALKLYAEADAGKLPPKWRYYPQYLAAKIEFFTFDLQAAKARLKALPKGTCAIPGYCYKPELLLQEILFAQDEFQTVTDALIPLRQQLEKPDRRQDYLADLCLLLVDLGIADTRIRHDERAMPELEAAMQLARQLQSRQLTGEALNGLATWHVEPAHRNLTLTADYLQQAADELRTANDDRAYVYVLNNLGSTYSLLGELQLAQQTYLQALPIAERSSDLSLRRSIYGSLANVYKKAGDWNPAEYYYRLSVELDAKSGRDGRQFDYMSSLGSLLRDKGDVKSALALHAQAQAYFRTNGPQAALATVLQEQGYDQLALGHLAEAGKFFESVGTQGDSGKRLYNSTDALIGRAQLAMAQGRLPLALQLAQSQWKVADSVDNKLQDKMQLALLLMRIEQSMGNLAMAGSYGEQMLGLSSDIRGQFEHIRLGAAWSARMQEGYKEYADILIQRSQQEHKPALLQQALAVLEGARGQSLLIQRELAGAIKGVESPERRNLRRRLTEISNRRAALLAGTPDYDKVSIEYFRLLEQYQSNFTSTEAGQHGMASFHIDSARRKLGGQKALVEFLCMPKAGCRALVMTDKDIKVFAAGSNDEVSQLANQLNQALRKPGSASERDRRRLGELLLGHVIADPMLAGRSELLLVTEFPLNNLPFAALMTGNDPLGTRFAICIIPSLATYQQETATKRKHALDVAVFADPVFSAEAVRKVEGSSREFNGWLQSLDRLRWSAREADELASVFEGSRVKLYTRAAATRKNLLKEETRNARILHIASHAYYNDSMQDLVGIAFSAADPADKTGDFVTLQELFDSGFGAELVVISGCDTGVGEYQPGEGNLSLARGFIAQGANQVISTLWPVSDRASVEFMRLFYQALARDGEDVGRALRDAQRSLANNKDYNDPYYWASYMLTAIN